MFIYLEYKDYKVDRRQPQVVLRYLLFMRFETLKINIFLLLRARPERQDCCGCSSTVLETVQLL